jgi:hypothetical protein
MIKFKLNFGKGHGERIFFGVRLRYAPRPDGGGQQWRHVASERVILRRF